MKLPRFAIWIYFGIMAAALIRVITALGLVDFRFGVNIAALCWILAFSLFVALYAPLLTRPRPDGRAG